MSGVAGLEQCCLAPGCWRIEGWAVSRGAGGWTLRWFADEPVVVVRTLREAREWIVDRSHREAESGRAD